MVLGFRMAHAKHRGSVLPFIPVSRERGKTKLRLERVGWKDVLIIVGLSFLFLVVIGVVLATFQARRPLSGIGLLLGTVGMIAYYGNRYNRLHRLQSVALLIRRWPLRLGESVEVTFRSRLNRPGVKAKLVCVEETRHSMGKYEERKSATRFELDLDTRSNEWQFVIPTGEPPSLAVMSNRVRWALQATITLDGQDFPAEFELLVVPEEVA
jgi:hypothetical protein